MTRQDIRRIIVKSMIAILDKVKEEQLKNSSMNELSPETYRSAANKRWDKGSARTRKPAGEQWHDQIRTPAHLEPVFKSKSLDKYKRAERLRDKKLNSNKNDI